MKAPNSAEHDASPTYLRTLVAQTGLSQAEAARRIGIGERTMRDYLREDGAAVVAPYPVQYALEMLSLVIRTDRKADKQIKRPRGARGR